MLPKWRLKKITVQGSGVKQRIVMIGLVSWVIISTFLYWLESVDGGKCSWRLFLRKGVDLEWVSYSPLRLKSNPLLIPLLHKKWSVLNPIHSLPRSWVWVRASWSEPVSTGQGFPNFQVNENKCVFNKCASKVGSFVLYSVLGPITTHTTVSVLFSSSRSNNVHGKPFKVTMVSAQKASQGA